MPLHHGATVLAPGCLLQGSAKLGLLRTCPTVPCAQGNAGEDHAQQLPKQANRE